VATRELTSEYVPVEVQARWQQAWGESDAFVVAGDDAGKDPACVVVAWPVALGGAHIGHVRGFCIADAYVRFCRAQGDAVLFSVGFDTFGAGVELEAIRHEVSSAEWVAQCMERMTGQFRRLGFSFDRSRGCSAGDPGVYRWSQRLFLMLLEDGLIYRAQGPVQWCDGCEAVLEEAQIDDGVCLSCGSRVQPSECPQWYLRSGTYRDENEQGLDGLGGYNELAIESQRTVLGRIDGVELDVKSLDGRKLTVFTPHTKAVSQAQFVAISPWHPEIDQWIEADDLSQGLQAAYLQEVQPDNEATGDGVEGEGDQEAPALENDSVDEVDVPLVYSDDTDTDTDTSGGVVFVDTGRVVVGAGTASPLPVVVVPSVDARFGVTAVLVIPAVDKMDAALARGIPSAGSVWRAKDDGPAKLREAVRYRLPDVVVSRQRSWGVPIPVVYCGSCGIVPVPADDLPVALPDLDGGSLAENTEFVTASCPGCSGLAKRETDTLDWRFGRLSQWMLSCVPPEARSDASFDSPEFERWLPVNRVVCSVDDGHWLFDQRTITKALRDRGLFPNLADGEPFQGVTTHEKVHSDGCEVSDHLAHTVDVKVDVDEVMTELGADAVRLAVLYGAAPTNPLPWNDNALTYCSRWLGKVWQYALPRLSVLAEQQIEPSINETESLHRQLQSWCDTALERVTENMQNLEMHKAARNAMRLLDRIEAFEQKALTRDTADVNAAVGSALLLLLRLLNPLAPHITEELWVGAEQPGLLTDHAWPESNPSGDPASGDGVS
jgi:leucyl-tRNA synthetase